MRALPLLIAAAAAAVMAPVFMASLQQGSHTRVNYRGRALPFPLGVLTPAVAAVALVPLLLIERLASTEVLYPETLPVVLYALGVIALGLIDDVLGDENTRESAKAPPKRGWRGHGAAVLRGELSTGALKAAGSLGFALLAMSYLDLSKPRWLLAAGVLVLATNLFNLLDLRPGRTGKVFVALGAALTAGAGELRPLWTLGLFAGPALVAGFYDLRERAMLGDTGANLLGALAGLWLVLSLSGTGQLIALLVLATITLYGEFRSISELVERTPGLRELDSLGRPS